MKYAGTTSLFEAGFGDAAPGTYELRITAADAENVNFGVATSELVVRAREAKE